MFDPFTHLNALFASKGSSDTFTQHYIRDETCFCVEGTTFSVQKRNLFHSMGKSPSTSLSESNRAPSKILPFDGLRWIKLAALVIVLWLYKRYVISTVTPILSLYIRLWLLQLSRVNATLLKLILRKMSHLANVRLPFLLIINNNGLLLSVERGRLGYCIL